MLDRPQLLERLRGALAHEPGLVSAYLFGSASAGRMHRESDVDVGVLLDRRRHPSAAGRFDVRLRLITRLQSVVGREVDLVILNDAPPHLCRRIMTEGTRVVVVEAPLDHAHLRVTLSRAADLEPFLRRTRAVKLQAVLR